MNKKATVFGAVGVLALLVGLGAQSLEVSDFLSGIVTGCCIVMEVIAIWGLAKAIKENKEKTE